jgi:hypothetical protein
MIVATLFIAGLTLENSVQLNVDNWPRACVPNNQLFIRLMLIIIENRRFKLIKSGNLISSLFRTPNLRKDGLDGWSLYSSLRTAIAVDD